MKYVRLAMILVTPKETLENALWGAENSTLSNYPSAPASGVKRTPTCLESEATDDRLQMSAILGDASQFLSIVKEHIGKNIHTKISRL